MGPSGHAFASGSASLPAGGGGIGEFNTLHLFNTEIKNNAGVGLEIPRGLDSAIIVNNLFVNNNLGIDIMDYSTVFLINNTIMNNGTWGLKSNSAEVDFVNNIVAGI